MASSCTPEKPLSDEARTALDVLYKHVADERIEEQQATIARLKEELAQKDEILKQELAKKDVMIARIKRGHGLSIRDVWEDYKYRNPWCRLRLEPSFYDMKLDCFLMQFAISWGHLKEAQDVFRVAATCDAKGTIEPPSTMDASIYTRRLAA